MQKRKRNVVSPRLRALAAYAASVQAAVCRSRADPPAAHRFNGHNRHHFLEVCELVLGCDAADLDDGNPASAESVVAARLGGIAGREVAEEDVPALFAPPGDRLAALVAGRLRPADVTRPNRDTVRKVARHARALLLATRSGDETLRRWAARNPSGRAGVSSHETVKLHINSGRTALMASLASDAFGSPPPGYVTDALAEGSVDAAVARLLAHRLRRPVDASEVRRLFERDAQNAIVASRELRDALEEAAPPPPPPLPPPPLPLPPPPPPATGGSPLHGLQDLIDTDVEAALADGLPPDLGDLALPALETWEPCVEVQLTLPKEAPPDAEPAAERFAVRFTPPKAASVSANKPAPSVEPAPPDAADDTDSEATESLPASPAAAESLPATEVLPAASLPATEVVVDSRRPADAEREDDGEAQSAPRPEPEAGEGRGVEADDDEVIVLDDDSDDTTTAAADSDEDSDVICID